MADIPAGNPAKPQGEDGRALLTRMNGGHHEELAVWGLSHVMFTGGEHMLDIGCGGGANVLRLLERSKDGKAYGIDYSPLSIELSHETCARQIEEGQAFIEQADVCNLPFENNWFDIVTAFETVYFWPDMNKALKEILRVMKPEAVFLICNEANGSTLEMREQAKAIDGMTMYTADDLERLLLECGFSIDSTHDTGEKGWISVLARK